MAIDDETLQAMIDAAREASGRAYCPYSRFRVGASVLADDGGIDSGCNVENASYGLSICAERSAVFRMAARGRSAIRGLVVYTPTPEPTAPCGACRQVIREFGPTAEVISACDGPSIHRHSMIDLLPGAFGPRDLGV